MKILRSNATRRAVGGAIAGLGLVFGVAAGASADAYIDANGIPVASSGSATVSIVDGEAVILFGDDATDELSVLTGAAETTETSLGGSPAVAISDASGGEHNEATPTR